ncbi:MAG TPA: protein-tyrosine-phosphatase [Cyclobacteriaceae bacterium]|nr:protein-tyrosine-phosphatase [Cyclobacteriaceae bacterium]
MFFVEDTIRNLLREFDRVPQHRKVILNDIAGFCRSTSPANLVFICTHNSRRSHISQVWAQTAAAYFNTSHVASYSGGTEATAFNPRAVRAMRELGFEIEVATNNQNPRYLVRYSDAHPSFEVFSKKYDDRENPSTGFAAIMTCTHADENCPVVSGASVRISLPFDDPKDFDGTDVERIKYHERSLEIGREILYAFSQIGKL